MVNNVLGIRFEKTSKAEAALEAFRSLRTNLIYSDDVQVITVTSTVPNEGKTTTAYNLAESFALMGKRVLLIDADLRKGSMKKYFVLNRAIHGLSELLTKQADDVILPTTNPKLDVILAGKMPPNSSELLSGRIFRLLIEKMRNEYNYIIIDTAPMGVAMDAAITGSVSDGVVLVVKNDFVKKKEVVRVKQQLERNGSRIIGVALNGVKKNQLDYQSYRYKYYGEKK